MADHTEQDGADYHGTYRGYSYYKCRGPRCRRANADYSAEYKRKRLAKGGLAPDDARHGDEATYTNYYCRCWECSVAVYKAWHDRYMSKKRKETRAVATRKPKLVNVTGTKISEVHNKRHYKPGDKAGDYRFIKVVKEEYKRAKDPKDNRYIRTWLIECACGYQRTTTTANIGRLNRCLTCARYLSRNGNDYNVLRMYQMTQRAVREYGYVKDDGYVMTANYLLPDWDGLEGPLS